MFPGCSVTLRRRQATWRRRRGKRWRRIGRTLADAGAGPADVVEGLVYLTEPAAFPLMNKEYREFFGKDFPARATVVVPLVDPDGLVEIMVTAVLPTS